MASITTYMEQLEDKAKAIGSTSDVLLTAFLLAGIPSSTYYRAKGGAELRSATALRVGLVLDDMLSARGTNENGKPKAKPSIAPARG